MTQYSKTQRFKPYSQKMEKRYARANRSYELPCGNCLNPFGDHYNGACPLDPTLEEKDTSKLIGAMVEAARPIHPFCNECGWRKGGPGSWNGRMCKCGHYAPPIERVTTAGD